MHEADNFRRSYLIADYERRNFSVHQCTWNANAQENLIPIKSLADKEQRASQTHHLSSGAIVGIAIGSLIALSVLGLLGLFLYKKRFSRKSAHRDVNEKSELEDKGRLPTELVGDKLLDPEIDGDPFHGSELDSKRLPGHELNSGEKPGLELDSGQPQATEMPVRETAAAELP